MTFSAWWRALLLLLAPGDRIMTGAPEGV